MPTRLQAGCLSSFPIQAPASLLLYILSSRFLNNLRLILIIFNYLNQNTSKGFCINDDIHIIRFNGGN